MARYESIFRISDWKITQTNCIIAPNDYKIRTTWADLGNGNKRNKDRQGEPVSASQQQRIGKYDCWGQILNLLTNVFRIRIPTSLECNYQATAKVKNVQKSSTNCTGQVENNLYNNKINHDYDRNMPLEIHFLILKYEIRL